MTARIEWVSLLYSFLSLIYFGQVDRLTQGMSARDDDQKKVRFLNDSFVFVGVKVWKLRLQKRFRSD